MRRRFDDDEIDEKVDPVDKDRSWFDDTKFIYDALSSRYDIVSLANAFRTTGNDVVANRLYLVAEQLEDASLVLNSMSGKMSIQSFNQAREGTRNVLTMAMMVVDPKNESGLRDVLPKMV